MLADLSRELVADVVENLDYQQRKERGICTYPGCPNPPDRRPGKESCECEEHHDATLARKKKHRGRRRRARNKLRKIWRRKKLCLRCGAKRLSREKHCITCLVAIGGTKIPAASKTGDNKGARIASNTSIDADGRSRYRGQGKRGQPKRGAIDAKDLGYALNALGRGAKGLAFVDALATEPLTKAQRHEAKTEALAQLDQAQRFIDDVLERHGYFGKVDPDDKPNRR